MFSNLLGNLSVKPKRPFACSYRCQPLAFPADRDVSPELKDLISLMLIKDPNMRVTLPDIKVDHSIFPSAV